MHLDARLFGVDSLFEMSVRSSLVFSLKGLAKSEVESVNRVKPRDDFSTLRSIELAEDRQNTGMGGSPREDVIWNSLVLRLGGIFGPARGPQGDYQGVVPML